MQNEHKPYGPYERFFKRPLDFVLALAALAVLSPLLLVLTVIGAFAMKGNPFFVQKRPGRIDKKTGQERIFKLIKFRSMSNAKDRDGNLLPDKDRLSVYGRFLRASSLDELPELINIVKGDMAIVGPRPLMKSYLPYYSKEERRRHTVRPGLTGYAQVNGRNMASWELRFEMDCFYVDHIKLVLDTKIIFHTIKTVLSHDGVDMGELEDLDVYRIKQTVQ